MSFDYDECNKILYSHKQVKEVNFFKKTFFVLISTFATPMLVDAREPQCPYSLLKTGWDGEVISGSVNTLSETIASGEKIRVGWAIDTNKNKKADVVHWSEAVFLSVVAGKVSAQVESIHQQTPTLQSGKVSLSESFERWHGMIGSDGLLQGRFEGNEKINTQQVYAVWCSEADLSSYQEDGGGWRLVYRSGLNGEHLQGSKNMLFNAIRAGQPIQIGWGLKRGDGDEMKSIEHVSTPVFLSIVDDTDIVAQLPEHVAQKSYWDLERTSFGEGSVMWRGVVSSTGMFDAIWVDRATGETVRHSPQRAEFSWYVQGRPQSSATPLARENGIIVDGSNTESGSN